MSWIGTLFGKADGAALTAQAKKDDANLAIADEAYAPGGRIYEHLLETDGLDAADRAWNVAQGHLSDDKVDTSLIKSQIGQAFDEGAAEGLKNITGGINSTLKAPFKFAWAAIPWQVWALGAVLLFFYMGGSSLLKGSLKR